MYRVRVTLVGIGLMLVASACSGTGALAADNNGERVSLAPGDEIEITLEGNITTGFAWGLVDYDPTIIATVSEPAYVEGATDAVGVGGTWTWTLRAVSKGESLVSFVYERPFEDVPPVETFSFTAVVSPWSSTGVGRYAYW
jgi:inhibitor of cysteine peptidase